MSWARQKFLAMGGDERRLPKPGKSGRPPPLIKRPHQVNARLSASQYDALLAYKRRHGLASLSSAIESLISRHADS